MPKYTLAPPDVQDLVAQSRERTKTPELLKVNVAAVLAEGANLPPAACRLTSPALRAAGAADALLVLDAARFQDSSAAGRLAMVEHGLAGLLVVFRGDRPSLDSSGRLRLRKRPFDIHGVGYAEMLKRHRNQSVEHAALRQIRDKTAGLGPDDGGPSASASASAANGKPKAPKPTRPSDPRQSA